jgi:cysteine-rich repeat protein
MRTLVLVGALGCSGTVSPNPTTPVTATSRTCPTIPTRMGSCSDFHLMNTALTCGGDGTMKVTTSSTPGGANRFIVQLMNGSRVLGSLVHNDPPCNITNGTDADFTFGAVYTGDQGTETDASGNTIECIVQSKLVFSAFNFDLVLMAPHEGAIKAKLHEAFDKEIVNAIYASQGKTLAGRCARWRDYRVCGDATIDIGETCDDGNTTPGDGCNATCTGA